MPDPARALAQRLPFYYGWIVVGVAFMTLGMGATARAAFSLLFAPILDESGWDRGIISSVFTLGFLSSALCVPAIGAAIDRWGPQAVLPVGALLVASGFAATTFADSLWHYYVTLGLLVIGGSMALAYNAHFLFLPGWFDRRRGLAIGLASTGVGTIAVLTLPWLQALIDTGGWRSACWVMAFVILVTLVPLNLAFQRRRPADLGLLPDGARPIDPRGRASSSAGPARKNRPKPPPLIVDIRWTTTEWTLSRALRTARFWLFSLAFFLALFAWYAILVHQTKFLHDLGFDRTFAALALGMVPLLGVAGQILLGLATDRMAREWVWTASCLGFALCYVAMLALPGKPEAWLVWVMVATQGFLGYGMTPAIGAIPTDLFQGRHYGKIFGVMAFFGSAGASLGPLVFGVLHDWTGSYDIAAWMAIGCCLVSIVLVWLAAPRKVRRVGR